MNNEFSISQRVKEFKQFAAKCEYLTLQGDEDDINQKLILSNIWEAKSIIDELQNSLKKVQEITKESLND